MIHNRTTTKNIGKNVAPRMLYVHKFSAAFTVVNFQQKIRLQANFKK